MKSLIFLILSILLTSLAANAQWVQVGQDIDGEAAQDLSGFSTSMSTDGTTIAIGATHNAEMGLYAGHVRIYEYNGGDWIQIGADIDAEAEGDNFGSSVSINNDGSRVAITSPHHTGINGTFSGQVQVFENENGAWTQIGDDIEGSEQGEEYGTVVSLSSDGKIMAIGSEYNDDGGNGSGQIQVFEEIDGTWTQLGNDINGGGFERLGYSVSLSADGLTVASGLLGVQSAYGAVRILHFDGENWQQVGDDIPQLEVLDLTGVSVSLNSDGNIVALGSPIAEAPPSM